MVSEVDIRGRVEVEQVEELEHEHQGRAARGGRRGEECVACMGTGR